MKTFSCNIIYKIDGPLGEFPGKNKKKGRYLYGLQQAVEDVLQNSLYYLNIEYVNSGRLRFTFW